MKKLSHKQIADKLEVTRQAVHKWFTGKTTPTLENIQALAHLHGVTIERMLAILKKSSSNK